MKLIMTLLAFLTLFFFSCKKDNEETNQDPFLNKTQFQEVVNPSFQNSAVLSILVDNLSNKWVGTGSGLFVFTNKIWYRYLKFDDLSINSLSAHKDDILIAASNGAYTINVTNNNINLSESINKGILGGTSDFISAYGHDIFDKKWIGSVDGLAFYDGSNWKRNEEIKNNLGGISDISSMAFRYNDCFFGTFGKYIYHISYENNTTVDAITGASQMLGGAADPESSFNGELTSDTVYCVFAGSDSSIWFGSTLGLTRNLGSTLSYSGIFDYFLRGERVHCVIEASDKKIWAGTENGLNVRTGSNWKKYNTTNGLPGNLILSLSEDVDKSIWIGTDKGISHFVDDVFINF